jgi:two-component system, OmpR family, alkaline phosphatase synthesis response regulator PhoP
MGMKTVLLIDDDSDFRSLFTLAIEAYGIVTRAFSSAKNGFDYLREAESLPDFILLDLNMPGLSGGDFIKRLRADERLQKIRVILVSGCNEIASIAERCGADGFLGKPFGLDEVDRLVNDETTSNNSISRRTWNEFSARSAML